MLSVSSPSNGQPVATCEVFDDYIPVGRVFPVEAEPGNIAGGTVGSRVNVRTGPGTEYAATAYGLVGDRIQVIGQAFSRSCDTWIQVRFSVSGHVGWVRADFIDLFYGRGWWD
ncbi:MAG: SH3 domain-containing protein [Leptolyngbyaceae cyanobacterium SM1_3_5]|nr:SH3 domain-containing protein [Leptolyngbyaceae cyanobacterium SM1_3_5]